MTVLSSEYLDQMTKPVGANRSVMSICATLMTLLVFVVLIAGLIWLESTDVTTTSRTSLGASVTSTQYIEATTDSTPFDLHDESKPTLRWESAETTPAENCHRFEFELPGATWIWQLNLALSQLNVVAQPICLLSSGHGSNGLSWQLLPHSHQESLITAHVRLQI